MFGLHLGLKVSQKENTSSSNKNFYFGQLSKFHLWANQNCSLQTKKKKKEKKLNLVSHPNLID
jgi:hypothetical protein